MSDILKIAWILEELGEKVLWLENHIRAGGREFYYDTHGQIISIRNVK